MVGLQNNRIICSCDFKIQLQEKLTFEAFLEVLIYCREIWVEEGIPGCKNSICEYTEG